jgi:hypothetical protein
LILPHLLLLGAAGGLLEAWVLRRPTRRGLVPLVPLPLLLVCGVHEAGRSLLTGDSYPPLVVKLFPAACAALVVMAALLVRTRGAAAPASSDDGELESTVLVPVREGRPWLRLAGATLALMLAGLVAIALLPRGA